MVGIYKITNKLNNRGYIGCSENVEKDGQNINIKPAPKPHLIKNMKRLCIGPLENMV